MKRILIIGGILGIGSALTAREAFYQYAEVNPDLCRQYIEAIKTLNPRLNIIPTALVMGYISAESSFRKNVKSGAGAIGLMQVKESTYDWLQNLYTDFQWKDTGLYDPYENIMAGMMYIYFIRKHSGADFLARIQMYNTGVSGYQDKGYRAVDYAGKVLAYSAFWII